jgi:hypothetical protein
VNPGGDGGGDGAPLTDGAHGDACLPIPADEVRGYYVGTWKGTWSCPGQSKSPVSGEMSFDLIPDGKPESFKVTGTMNGMVQSVAPFSSSISGRMGCTALSASLPNIRVGSGALMYSLKGTFKGVFGAIPSRPAGFKNGAWTASETSGNCNASGTWKADFKSR